MVRCGQEPARRIPQPFLRKERSHVVFCHGHRPAKPLSGQHRPQRRHQIPIIPQLQVADLGRACVHLDKVCVASAFLENEIESDQSRQLELTNDRFARCRDFSLLDETYDRRRSRRTGRFWG